MLVLLESEDSPTLLSVRYLMEEKIPGYSGDRETAGADRWDGGEP